MKSIVTFILFLFSIVGLFAQPANDNSGSATAIGHSSNNCSANAAFTTVSATTDGNTGSCWENGPNYTVWFSFVATSANVTLDMKVGGVEGTLRHPNMALWQADATTEIKCVRRINATTDVQLSTSGLIIGNTYFVSCDNYVGAGYQGTFTLCIDDQVNYDEPAGAIVIAHTSNNCSANAAYSTVHATTDGNAGSCWENGPNYTRWFSFVATSTNVTLDMKVGGVQGTLRHPNMALWESDATTEIKCVRRLNAITDVQISSSSLVIGNTYYVSCDNYVGLGYRGTFTLCIDDQVTYDEIAGAITLLHSSNNCSIDAAYTTINATADGNAGSCWENGPNYTRWFSFVATSTNVTLDMKVGGVEGTLRHPNMALWESNATTEVACVRRLNATADVQISISTLTIGNTYYVSCDNYVGLGYRGTFTLCIDDQVTYDEIIGAKTLIHTTNNCSVDAEYTTVNATADGNVGSCWENGPNYTRWFSFVATTSNVTLDMKVGGVEGTLRHPNMALWESNATSEVACVRRLNATADVQISISTLTIGNTYYVSCDNYVGLGYRGTFTLCIDDQVTYDEIAGAKELTNLNNWCSADAQYTTINATSDGLMGSCWENGPNYTRWFKFTAVSPNVTLQMKVGGVEGSLRHPNMALWQSNATTEIACVRRINATTDVSLSSAALVVGNVYYISCDNYVGLGYRGTFTLCIDNVDTDYYSIADGDWADGTKWSTVSHAGPAAASFPNAGDLAHIKRNTITVTGNEVCAEVNLSDSVIAATKLEINTGTLVVSGQVNMDNTTNNLSMCVNITGGGSLTVNDNFTATRASGNSTFYLNIDNNSSVNINKDLEFISSGGVILNNEIILNGTAAMLIGQDFKLNNTGGIKTFVQLNNTATLSVDRDIEFIASADNLNEIEMNNTSSLRIKRSFVRGIPAYGILTSNNSPTVIFNGNAYSQIVATGGSGTGDTFSYENITFDNSYITVPQLVLTGGNLNVTAQIVLNDGILQTTSGNLLILENTSTTILGSSASYVDGPLRKVGTGAYTFHVGDANTYAPISISAPALATDHFTAEYFEVNPDALYSRLSKDVSLNHISGCEYWILDRTNGSSNVNVTLSWDTRSCGVSTMSDLAVARWDGGQWKDHGNNIPLLTGSNAAGTVTTSAAVTTFSPFTLASISFENPLPIELVSFEAELNGKQVDLNWITSTEINNDFFTIERSLDLNSWQELTIIPGAGNSSQTIEYYEIDNDPISGVSYYRLKQTDFDGKYSYSGIESVDFDRIIISEDISLFPNPVKSGETITVEFEGIYEDEVLLVIKDVLGKEFYSKKLVDIEDGKQINIPIDSGIESGIYFISVIAKNKAYNQKLIVQ
jgi:hypothetical protein